MRFKSPKEIQSRNNQRLATIRSYRDNDMYSGPRSIKVKFSVFLDYETHSNFSLDFERITDDSLT